MNKRENEGVPQKWLENMIEKLARKPEHGIHEQPKRAGHRGRGYTKPLQYNKRRRAKRRIRRKMAKRSRRINRK